MSATATDSRECMGTGRESGQAPSPGMNADGTFFMPGSEACAASAKGAAAERSWRTLFSWLSFWDGSPNACDDEGGPQGAREGMPGVDEVDGKPAGALGGECGSRGSLDSAHSSSHSTGAGDGVVDEVLPEKWERQVGMHDAVQNHGDSDFEDIEDGHKIAKRGHKGHQSSEGSDLDSFVMQDHSLQSNSHCALKSWESFFDCNETFEGSLEGSVFDTCESGHGNREWGKQEISLDLLEQEALQVVSMKQDLEGASSSESTSSSMSDGDLSYTQWMEQTTGSPHASSDSQSLTTEIPMGSNIGGEQLPAQNEANKVNLREAAAPQCAVRRVEDPRGSPISASDITSSMGSLDDGYGGLDMLGFVDGVVGLTLRGVDHQLASERAAEGKCRSGGPIIGIGMGMRPESPLLLKHYEEQHEEECRLAVDSEVCKITEVRQANCEVGGYSGCQCSSCVLAENMTVPENAGSDLHWEKLQESRAVSDALFRFLDSTDSLDCNGRDVNESGDALLITVGSVGSAELQISAKNDVDELGDHGDLLMTTNPTFLGLLESVPEEPIMPDTPKARVPDVGMSSARDEDPDIENVFDKVKLGAVRSISLDFQTDTDPAGLKLPWIGLGGGGLAGANYAGTSPLQASGRAQSAPVGALDSITFPVDSSDDNSFSEWDWTLQERPSTTLSEPYTGIRRRGSKQRRRMVAWLKKKFKLYNSESDEDSTYSSGESSGDGDDQIELEDRWVPEVVCSTISLSDGILGQCVSPSPRTTNFTFEDAKRLNRAMMESPVMAQIDLGAWTSKMICFTTPAEYYTHMCSELCMIGVNVLAIMEGCLSAHHALVQDVKMHLLEEKTIPVEIVEMPRASSSPVHYSENQGNKDWSADVLGTLLGCGINGMFFDRDPGSFSSEAEYHKYLGDRLKAEGINSQAGVVPELVRRLGKDHPLIGALQVEECESPSDDGSLPDLGEYQPLPVEEDHSIGSSSARIDSSRSKAKKSLRDSLRSFSLKNLGKHMGSLRRIKSAKTAEENERQTQSTLNEHMNMTSTFTEQIKHEDRTDPARDNDGSSRDDHPSAVEIGTRVVQNVPLEAPRSPYAAKAARSLRKGKGRGEKVMCLSAVTRSVSQKLLKPLSRRKFRRR